MGIPVILIPSPNVAEDHQTQNAMALVRKKAAEMIPDGNAKEQMIPRVIDLMKDESRLKQLSANIKKLGLPDSSERIVDEIYKLI